jgi:hypothetical protein
MWNMANNGNRENRRTLTLISAQVGASTNSPGALPG